MPVSFEFSMTDILNKNHLAWFTICLKKYCKNEVWIFAIQFGTNASAVASLRYLFLLILSVPIAILPDACQMHKPKKWKITSQLFEHEADKKCPGKEEQKNPEKMGEIQISR